MLRGVDIAIHLAWVLQPTRDRAQASAINLGGTRRFLEACAVNHVPRVLLVSSATAYGAWRDNPVPIPEQQLVRADQPLQYAREKAIMEGLARQWNDEHRSTAMVIVRPCIVVGPHVDNFISRMLLKPVVPMVAGADPPLQAVHEHDCVRAIYELARRGPAGTYNIGAEGALPISHLARRFGARLVPLPLRAAQAFVRVGWQLGLAPLTEAPPAILDFFRYPWVVDGARLSRSLGYRYQFDTLTALETLTPRPSRSRVAAR